MGKKEEERQRKRKTSQGEKSKSERGRKEVRGMMGRRVETESLFPAASFNAHFQVKSLSGIARKVIKSHNIECRVRWAAGYLGNIFLEI